MYANGPRDGAIKRSQTLLEPFLPSWRQEPLNPPSNHRASNFPKFRPQEFVEVLHSRLHRALIRPDLRFTAIHQRAPARIHALGDFVVFARGLEIRGPLSLDEFALEQRDFLRIIKLDDIRRLLR